MGISAPALTLVIGRSSYVACLAFRELAISAKLGQLCTIRLVFGSLERSLSTFYIDPLFESYLHHSTQRAGTRPKTGITEYL